MTFDLTAFLPRAVMQGIPLLYGSTGEILTEKSGNLNLGIPGVMYVGGICGVIGAFFYEQSTPAADMNAFLAIGIPMLCSLLGSLLMGLLYCLLTVTLRANQNVTGLALTTFGVGIGNFFGGSLIKLTDSEVPSIALSATSAYFSKSLNVGGWFGQVFLSYGFLAYLAIVIALFASYFLKHTRTGLHLRAVGESAATAVAAASTRDEVQIPRHLHRQHDPRVSAACITSWTTPAASGPTTPSATAAGSPSRSSSSRSGVRTSACWPPSCSGFIIYFHPTGTNLAIKELYKMLPYVVTLVVLIIVSLRPKARGSAAHIAGSELLPRREINLKTKAPDGCFCFGTISALVAHPLQSLQSVAADAHVVLRSGFQFIAPCAALKIETRMSSSAMNSIYFTPCA